MKRNTSLTTTAADQAPTTQAGAAGAGRAAHAWGRRPGRLALAVLALSLLLVAPGGVLAADVSFTVNSAADTTTSGTPCQSGAAGCSLRQAIQETNALPAGSNVTITLPANTYLLSPSLGGLSLRPANLLSGVRIFGAGQSTTIIDGGHTSTVTGVQVLTISSRAGAVVINGVTIQNGNAANTHGGGINNDGTLTLTNSTLSGNTSAFFGGGISNQGTLTVTNSTLTGNAANVYSSGYSNGGGISNFGTLTVANSTLSGNSASGGLNGFGGGIHSDRGTVTLTNSTLSGNTASGTFGASTGGGISIYGSTLTLTNSTLSGNSASSGYGGGIATDSSNGTTSLANTIVANSGIGGDCSGPITDNGYNLDSDNSCGLQPANGSMRDLPNTDPKLGPLQNNGGPTLTMALLPGSPAIDAGGTPDANPTCIQGTDQRGPGFPRLINGACDIGAFEVQSASTATTLTLTVACAPADAQGSFKLSLAGSSNVVPCGATLGAVSVTAGQSVSLEERVSSGSLTPSDLVGCVATSFSQSGTVFTTSVTPAAGSNSCTVTNTRCTIGDVNCSKSVDAVDALCVLRQVAGLGTTSSCPFTPAGPSDLVWHVSSSGSEINAVDALCILRSVAKLPGTAVCTLTS
ncbi:MAG: choice-of-anchor Q domain-containing protein [Dehalococcoidia bacterium]